MHWRTWWESKHGCRTSVERQEEFLEEMMSNTKVIVDTMDS